MLYRQIFAATCAGLLLSACGGSGDGGTGNFASSGDRGAECPPEQKGDGLMVGSRWNFEDLEKAQNWQVEIPPSSCAGALGELIPDFPAGYGLMPNNKPYVMNNQQVYLLVAEVPDQLKNEYGGAFIPENHAGLGMEILRFTSDEKSKTRTWMEANPGSYRTTEVDGHEVYLMSAVALARPNKRDRMGGGLVALLSDNIVVKLTHPEVYRQDSDVLKPGGIVYDTMKTILDKSGV